MSTTSIVTTNTTTTTTSTSTTTTTTTTTKPTSNLNNNNDNWESIELNNNHLDLRKTLLSGQSFRWRNLTNESDEKPTEWGGPLDNHLVILRRVEDRLEYKFIDKDNRINHNTTDFNIQKRKDILIDYFHLQHNLSDLCKQWANDSHSLNKRFAEVHHSFSGLRLLRQSPLECLFSFICSQNNNISRITKMVESLSSFGEIITTYDSIKFHSFPTLDQILLLNETQLNQLGFGYRSKFIVRSAQQVKEKGGVTWLESLRKLPHNDAHKQLTSLLGVGQKVADCVCLFSMDKLDIVPIDTHIFKISKKHMTSLKATTLSPKIYEAIRSFWKERFGNFAGWGHTILFANEIAAFKNDNIKKGIKRDNDEIETDETKETKQNENKEEDKDEDENEIKIKDNKRSRKKK